ncbi:MAG: SusD/RagB family nutrient-binding outer membrane lipoprotein [Bacteroidia bacterium]|nr:SusD/RagB family nutrient-binding outer membrane lipoprotein [Bacteroidia bacterium]
MKKKLRSIVAVVAFLPFVCSCVGSFEEYNTNPYEPHKLNPPMLFAQMITTGINVQQNDNQMIDQMVAGPFGGYLTMSNSWGGANFNTYNQTDAWNQIPFNTPFEKFYPNYFQLEKATGGKGHFWAMAKLLRVNTMHRVTDCYGPIPYSQIKAGNTSVGYDSQEEVYNHLFEDLDFAITTLKAFVAETSLKPLAGYDEVYHGDYKMWIRYANSLKLRLAIRISGVAPELAQKKAEEAVADEGGLIETNDQNAMVGVGAEPNPLWLVGFGWGEIRANATIVSYMNGYTDPRRADYFTTSTLAGDKLFAGMRSGLAGVQPATYKAYSIPNYEQKDAMMMFCASEVAFLRAEGALKNWAMGGTAQAFYEAGIRLSFEQHKAGGVEAYLANSDAVPEAFADVKGNSKCGYIPQTKITVAWNEAADEKEKLERIITQKWIANFPLGFEGWADYRRTGYPEIFPTVDNLSQGGISTERQQRRLPFPFSEKKGNSTNVQAAVVLLGGPDTGATDLWWAKKN